MLLKIRFFVPFIILAYNSLFAQNTFFATQKDAKHPPPSFIKTEGQELRYKQQGDYFISEILLFPDSTFVYYFVSSSRYDLTVGAYFKSEELILLNWDSLKTLSLSKDTSFYNKYFKLKPPKPFKITDKQYWIKSSSLELIKYVLPNRKAELFSSCENMPNKGLEITPFTEVRYNSSGEKLIFKSPTERKEFLLSKDSVWGYKTSNDWDCALYRIAPKGINWYGYAGIQIVQIDQLIIYTVGTGFTYSFFSKKLNSKIYPLTRVGIIDAFKDNIPLQTIILKEAEKLPSYWAINENTDCFKIIEIYKNALQKLGLN